MKYFMFIGFLVCFAATTAVLAQSNPTVEIVLSQPTAQNGSHIGADVYIRNAANIGGADVGMTVDEQCLRIVNRTDGNFLPTTSEAGGFSPFAELHDHDTRFASAITNRSKLGNGSGVFFHVDLEVTCDQGVAPLTVTFAELSAYKDPAAQEIELVAYTLSTGTVNVVNAQLAIGPEGQVTAVALNTPEAQTSVAAPNTTPGETIAAAPQNQIVPVAVIGLTIVGVIVLIFIFWFMRRRSRDEDQI